MKVLRLPLLLLAVIGLAFGMASAQAPLPKAYLLHVSKGQLPNDIGSDDKTKPELVMEKALGGKAMKVAFAPGDSFGVRGGKVKNWKQYARFRFDALVPGANPVDLELTIVHGRSTNYNTRVVRPIKLKPGKNEVQIGIDELTNVNGSAPDLANVAKWYIADVNRKAPTVLFGDIYLEGGSVASPIPGGPAGPQPLIGYRIKGKVNNIPIDLTITPFIVPSTATQPPVAVHGDPARLARIRAAKMPKIDKPILFDTPEADAILSALEVYPPDNPFNLVVEDWPLHPDSSKLIASIGPDKPFRYNADMGFVLVPPDQKKVEVKIVGYPGESDKGPFPVPDNTPIEGWPLEYNRRNPKLTLDDVQRNTMKEKGDRHAIIVDPTNRKLYEFFVMRKTDGGWQANQSSVFDLKTNALRPDGWTSADAAGLPIFPATVRYDELKRGLVEHAMRVTVRRSRKEYVYPATHQAGHGTESYLPRMGERIRLKKNFDIAGFSPEVQAILRGLKKYGMFVADNGIDWAISVTPDPRIKNLGDELRKLKGSDFEVVQPPTGYRPPVD